MLSFCAAALIASAEQRSVARRDVLYIGLSRTAAGLTGYWLALETINKDGVLREGVVQNAEVTHLTGASDLELTSNAAIAP